MPNLRLKHNPFGRSRHIAMEAALIHASSVQLPAQTGPSQLQIALGVAGAFAGALCFWPLVRQFIASSSEPDWASRKHASTLLITAWIACLFVFAMLDGLMSTHRVDTLELAITAIPIAGYFFTVWRNGKAPVVEPPNMFSVCESGASYDIARWWHFVAISAGVLLLLGSYDLETRLWGLGFLTVGMVVFGFRLYQHIGPPPNLTGPYRRPFGQMLIATVANVLLGAGAAGCAIAGGMAINSQHPERAQLDNGTLAVAFVLILLQAVAIPLHGWWRWSGERDTKKLVQALADEMERRASQS